MINSLVAFALRKRLVVAMVSLFIASYWLLLVDPARD
jgi:hypothetical protein